MMVEGTSFESDGLVLKRTKILGELNRYFRTMSRNSSNRSCRNGIGTEREVPTAKQLRHHSSKPCVVIFLIIVLKLSKRYSFENINFFAA